MSIHGRQFASSKRVLQGKAPKLREMAKGKQPNKAVSFTEREEEILWQCGQFGDTNPRALLNTVWWNVVQQFGLRGRELHYDLKIGDFKVENDNLGRKFVSFIEGPSKTRQGGLNFKPRHIHPRMYAIEGDRCPVRYFELFKSKRPEQLKESGPLYLAVIDNPKYEKVWYKSSRIGIHYLNNIVRNMISKSPLADKDKKLKIKTTPLEKQLFEY